MRTTAIAIVAALTPSVAGAASMIYEGFNYPTGVVPFGSMTGGNGWSGSFTGYFNNAGAGAPITAGSYVNPNSPPATGNALGINSSSFETHSLGRDFAQSLPTDRDVWMSMVFKVSDLASQGSFMLSPAGGGTAVGLEFYVAGFRLNNGSGTTMIQSWKGHQTQPNFYFLMRLGPSTGSERPLELWINPGPVMGTPDISTMSDTIIAEHLGMTFSAGVAVDEIRIDSNLANVYVPAPSAAALFLIPLVHRRRRTP